MLYFRKERDKVAQLLKCCRRLVRLLMAHRIVLTGRWKDSTRLYIKDLIALIFFIRNIIKLLWIFIF